MIKFIEDFKGLFYVFAIFFLLAYVAILIERRLEPKDRNELRQLITERNR